MCVCMFLFDGSFFVIFFVSLLSLECPLGVCMCSWDGEGSVYAIFFF